ncbi:MAG TPA: MFS transporter [archaeon]|nr:MFS transporter [archaeon]
MKEDNRNRSQAKVYRHRNLQIIFGVTLVAVMGVATITPAFPKIVRELNITDKQVGLLITFFTLPGVILTPIFGILADRLGRRKVLVPSLILFGVAGGACAFVREFNTLLLLRFFQGIGGAALGSLNVTIIGDIYTEKQRIAAMGYNSTVLSLGTASYPAVGGVLATFGWYYPFALPFMAIPMGLVVLCCLKNPEPEIQEGFIEYLKNALQSVKSLRVAFLFTAGLITFIILYGAYLTFFPLLLGHSFTASPFVIGLLMSSMSVTTALTSSTVERMIRIRSERFLLQTAFVLYTVSLSLIPFCHNIWVFLIPVLIFGFAQGINIPVIVTMLTASAPLKYRGAFMSVNGLVLRLGQTVGPLVMGEIFILWGMPGVFFAGACFSTLLVVLLVIMLR